MTRRVGCCVSIMASFLLLQPLWCNAATPGPSAPAPVAMAGTIVVTESAIGGRSAIIDTLAINITASAALDAETGLYEYTYSLKNHLASEGSIQRFCLGPLDLAPQAVIAPEHWGSAPLHRAGHTVIVWRVADLGPAPPGWTDDGVSVYQSIYCVDPGDSLSGFSFMTAMPPGRVEFSVDAWEEIRPLEDARMPEFPFRTQGWILGPQAEE